MAKRPEVPRLHEALIKTLITDKDASIKTLMTCENSNYQQPLLVLQGAKSPLVPRLHEALARPVGGRSEPRTTVHKALLKTLITY